MSPPPENASHAQFLRLYAEHEGALHTFVRSMLPTREDAMEVMQGVIVILWQKFTQVNEFRPWAFGVARIAVLRHLERRKRDRHVFDSDLVHRLADESAARSERHSGQREALEICLHKLPATQRELVLTAYTRGVRIDDLANLRGQTPMALYKVLHRIRQTLLECVQRTMALEDTL